MQSVVQASKVSSSTSPDSKRAREKPFQCNICQKRYTNRAGLTVHVLSHARGSGLTSPRSKANGDSNAKQVLVQGPYECRICSVRFMQKSPLIRHIGTDHADVEKFQAAVNLGLLPASLSLPFPTGPTLSDEIFLKYNAEHAPPRASYSPGYAPATVNKLATSSPTAVSISSPEPTTEQQHVEQPPATPVVSAVSSAASWQPPSSTFDLKQSLAMSQNLTSTLSASGADKPLPVMPGDLPNPAFPFYPLAQPNQSDLQSFLSTFRDRFMGNFLPPVAPDAAENPSLPPVARTDEHTAKTPTNAETAPQQPTTSGALNTQPPRKPSASGSSRGRPPGTSNGQQDGKERPFQCMFCEKRFTQRAGLNAHVLIHSGTKPFACSVCDKRFTQKSGLDQHFLTHTGERPHQCPMCDKRFTQKANLNNHILTHTGEKRHECPFCSRRFTQKANLNAHILTHTGEKPHQCMVCDRKFTQKSGLNQHILTHTGTEPSKQGKRKRESYSLSSDSSRCNRLI